LVLYILLGLAGIFYGGYFLYNIGTNLYGLVPQTTAQYFNYPDITSAGIIPYLNVAVFLKVSAGLSTLLLVLLEVKR
ncbi:MAG: MnhB domain-containing protein, partial [Candidatus Altiarchaeota archaeon]